MAGCLSENTVQELVGAALSSDARARALLHIETCAACRTLVIELARDGDIEAGLALRPPRRVLVDRFEIVRPLGRGGMGAVYEALDRERGTRVALKTLHHVSADGLLRFKTEFRALQDVQHPNLVALGELIEDRSAWWITMELVDGVSLLHHVRPGGQLDEQRLRAALPQLAAGLSALHAHGLVHRDVKPHNVLVTPARRVVLVDFGLVAGLAESESNVVGTPAYMAPEQGLLQAVGPAADWYGVGAVLYEALTGALPFQGAPLQVLVAKQHEVPRRPRELGSVPADLDALCMQLLAIDPEVRLGAVATLAGLAGLDRGAAAVGPPVAPAPSPVFVGRRRELASLADAFADARAGAETIVLIEGESGIGKSALVREFLSGVRERDPAVQVLAGRCYQRETVPYKGVDGVVDALARYLRHLPDAEAAAVLPRRAGLLVQTFPVLAKIPALRRLPADDVRDAAELRIRAFSALRELLGRLAERCPLVIWIDDLQWADADSLELLVWVMAPPEAPPLLLLLASRPRNPLAGSRTDAATARLHQLPALRPLELLPLARDEAVALAERLLSDDPTATATAARAAIMADEAAGHPLFIDALVRDPAVRQADEPPIRLSDALWARCAGLEPPARQLLAVLAVAGWPMSLELLAAAAELSGDDIERALAQLRSAHLVRAADGTRARAVEPYHDRIREAVLDHLDLDLRKACHRAIARALVSVDGPRSDPPRPRGAAEVAPPGSESDSVSLGPEVVGVHLHAAGDVELAAHYMVQAADRAAAALAFDRAARLFHQALEFHDQCEASPGPLGDTRAVRVRLARALMNASRGAEAAAVHFDLARIARAAGEDDLALRLRGAEQLLRSGHHGDGWRALAGVLDELGLNPAATRAGALGRVLWRRAWVRMRGFGSQAPHAQAPSPRELLRIDACRVAWMTSALPSEYFTRYQVLALKISDPRSRALALLVEVALAILIGSAGARRTARLIEELAAEARRSDDPFVLGQEQSMRSLCELELGHWERGREHGARAVQVLRERCLGASYETAGAAVPYFLCLYYLGELRDYVRELPPLLREAEERGDHFTLTMLHSRGAGLMSLIRDQPETARQQVDRAMAVRSTAEIDARLMAGQVSATEIELYEGDGVAAYRRIDHDWRRRIAQPFARMRFMRGLAFSTHGRAALAACRARGLDRDLVRATARDARALRAMRMPWTSALAQVLDAGIAGVTGARAQARAQLERAHAELSAAGMKLHAALVQRRLGELLGGSEGAGAIARVDAWLVAQGVRAPERFAEIFIPAVG